MRIRRKPAIHVQGYVKIDALRYWKNDILELFLFYICSVSYRQQKESQLSMFNGMCRSMSTFDEFAVFILKYQSQLYSITNR